MKSGLRDRNNTHKEIPYGFSCCSVSMKSGLRDRNNPLGYDLFDLAVMSQWSPVLETGTIAPHDL